jgi:hypothetical protein
VAAAAIQGAALQLLAWYLQACQRLIQMPCFRAAPFRMDMPAPAMSAAAAALLNMLDCLNSRPQRLQRFNSSSAAIWSLSC